MDTNLKNAIAAMRKDIAAMEKVQKNTKSQRKTVNFTGERTIEPWEAADLVRENKYELRLYYAAYGLLRGKNFDVTENRGIPDENVGEHPLCHYLPEIDEILHKYGYAIKNYEEKKNYWGQLFKVYNAKHYEEIVCVGQ